MQLGIGLDEHEIRDLIKAKVASLTGELPENLDVSVTCWNGRLATCTTHIDCKTHLHLKERTP